MLWQGSITDGNGEKLSDEAFRLLAEPGAKGGWKILKTASFFVNMREWESIAYLLDSAYKSESEEWDTWRAQHSKNYKKTILLRFMADLTDATRKIKNTQEAKTVIDQFFVMPMGLFVRPDAINLVKNSKIPLVIR